MSESPRQQLDQLVDAFFTRKRITEALYDGWPVTVLNARLEPVIPVDWVADSKKPTRFDMRILAALMIFRINEAIEESRMVTVLGADLKPVIPADWVERLGTE